jgi:hypothetical protein
MFSPPPGLSQSTTSFIASCCQGIHQTPFSRLIRSRRRQALLCCGGSRPQTCPWPSGRKSLTHGPPSTDAPTVRIVRTIPRDQTNNHGQYIRLGKTVFGCPFASGCLRTFVPPSPDARTAFAPHSAQTQKRLVFLLSSQCQSSGLLNPDDLSSHLSIRQPNTSEDVLANLVVMLGASPVLELRSKTGWWSLSFRRDAKQCR